MVERIPMGRMGASEEVAALACWLASEECSFSTGATYDISGGRAVVLMRRLIRWIDQDGRVSLGVEPRKDGHFHAIVGTDDPMRLLQGESFPVTQVPIPVDDEVSLELGDGLTLLMPWDPPEVWCAGVTYRRSRDARMAESAVQDVYDLVYEANRPELFLKDAGCRRTVGPMRADRDPRRLGLERARAGDRACRRGARPDPRVHDRQRRLLARDRGREPART